MLPKVKEIMSSLPSLIATVIFETVPSMGSNVDSPEMAEKVFTYGSFTTMRSLEAEVAARRYREYEERDW